jgi:hypothetical protein
MFNCIEGAPLLSNFLGSRVRILLLFRLNSPYFRYPKGSFPPPLGTKDRQRLDPTAGVLAVQFRLCRLFWQAVLLLVVSCGADLNCLCAQVTKLDSASASATIKKMEAARDEIAKGLERVSASGKISGWVQTPGALETQNGLDAEFLILRDGPRFHLQLLHAPRTDKTPPEPKRLEVAVFDGKAIYTFSSTGSDQERGGIFFEFSNTAVLRSTGFPFTALLNFWDDAISLKEIDQSSLSLFELGQTGTQLKEDRATYLRQINIGTDNPFDIQRVALRHPGASVAFREHWLTWQSVEKTRYVRHYVVRHRYLLKDAPQGIVIARQFEVDVEKFTPNAKHDQSAFTLEGLGVPVGTVFTDYRRNVKGKRVTMLWNGKTLEEFANSPPDVESPN